MPKVAFVIPGSPTPAFYSQIAAISLALRTLPWTRWTPSIHAFFGGEYTPDECTILSRWIPHLQDVTITRVSQERFAREDNWAQCDVAMLSAPRDADVLVALDADTLPVAGLENILDRVHNSKSIAGVMAHFPFPGARGPEEWNSLAETLIGRSIDFPYTHSLVGPDEPEARRRAPFYLNGGVVFYSRACFGPFLRKYLSLRNRLMREMTATDFSSQVAHTLAIAEREIPAIELPMRYNFPNDEASERLHPVEALEVVIYHYLRTDQFDRHTIFTTRAAYDEFLSLQLSGPNLRFQNAVREILGEEYPF